MTTYAVGDIQGCRLELEMLLDAIGFGEDDQMWFVGDLVNRGADSLGTLRLVKSMGEQAVVVLGNHDLHLLAIHYGGHRAGKNDTFDEVLSAPDCDALMEWLLSRRILHVDPDLGYVMTHAGLPHVWSLEQAVDLAGEVEACLAGEHADVDRATFFAEMYGNSPDVWSDALRGMDRLRVITNYFTRMRLIGADGRMDFAHKGALADKPEGWHPWYELLPETYPLKILFGHWAALDGVTPRSDVIALDTGCVWGRTLTARNLDAEVNTSIAAQV